MDYFTYHNYNICLSKKAHNKNIYFRVQRDGSIKVTSPYHLSKDDVLKYLDSFINKLEKKYNTNNLEKISYDNDSKIAILDKTYTLKIIEITSNKAYVMLKEDHIIVHTKTLEYNMIKKLLDNFINNIAKKVLNERFFQIVNTFEEISFIPELKIRNMTSRYGVCYYKKNRISLSVMLIHYDYDCIDYVIYHELAHFIHPNHSKKFYNLIERYVPNYKQAIKKLQNRL